jgi:hypothetical protein
MQRYEVMATSKARPCTVYALLLDGRSWPEWMGVDAVDVEPTSSVDGSTAAVSRIGQIRLIRTNRYVSREQIVELIPDRKFSYIVLDGMLHDYRGDVTLTSSPKGGTEIRWCGVFRMSFPLAGWLMKLYLSRFMQRGVDKLARYAEQVQGERCGDD